MVDHELLSITRTVVHYSLHLLAPCILAFIFFRQEWKKAWLIMIATMLADADHLLAHPIFDPNRCSIGYHPLHSYFAIAVYCILLMFSRTRIIAVGLLFHMLTDWQDCEWIGLMR